ncbi:MAG: hypothetical protein DRQ13_04195 [Ignavibacteriae bacterium]|nr:MAG: hypothetical protein DRQ13_04195 [Ignavibacteriota bacterium]
MKKLLFNSFVFFLVLSPVIKAQWVQQYSGNPSRLFTINFVDENNGFASGGNKCLLKTTDGGNNWIVLQQGGSSDEYGTMFIRDLQTGWIALNGWSPVHSSILKTTDGGISWTIQLSIYGHIVVSIFFIDDQIGWAACTEGVIYNTINGGDTWNLQYQLSTSEWLFDVFFVDQNNGWVVGNLGNKILKTTNGGNSWNWVTIGTSDWLFYIDFIDHDTGITVGDNGRILKSTDGGINWNTMQSGTTSLLREVEFSSINEVWAVGYNGVILHSTDVGNTWNLDPSGTSTDIYSVSFIGSQGWVCGDDQLILHNSGASGLPINIISPNGGEIWIEGSQQDITWSSLNVTDVKIELSLNNGASWDTIIDSTLSTGIFSWTVPNSLSDSCLIKISDYQYPDTLDISDGMFAIRSQASLSTVTVISPNGGESWVAGTQQNITWTSEFVENVKIELSLTNGANWNTIVDSIPSTGIYSWLVNVPQSSIQSRIRITNILDQAVYDVSDQVFTIQVPVDVENQLSGLPKEYKLTQNYPNPFNPSTTIKFAVPIESNVNLSIYNVMGELVSTLVNEQKKPGYYEYEFNASTIASGVYLYRIKAGSFVETKKMALMK